MKKLFRKFGLGAAVLGLLLVFVQCGDPAALLETIETQVEAAQDAGSPEIAVLLNNALMADGGSLNLGYCSISGTTAVNVEIRNTGDASLLLSADAVTLTGSSRFSTSGFGTEKTVFAGDDETFAVSFNPSAETAYETQLTIASNDPALPLFTCTIRGTGADSAGVVSTSPVHGTGGVLKGSNLSVVYSKEIDASSLTSGVANANIAISPAAGIACSLSNSGGLGTITINPSSDLTPGTGYTVSLNGNYSGGKILDTSGFEADSCTFSFTVLPLPTAPSTAPSPVNGDTLDPLTSSSITLDWDDFSNVDSYILFYKYDGEASYHQVSRSSSSYAITPQTGKQYSWYVRGINNSGTVDYPDRAWTFTAGYYIPSAPVIVGPTDGARMTTTTVRLRWNAADNAATYVVRYRNYNTGGD